MRSRICGRTGIPSEKRHSALMRIRDYIKRYRVSSLSRRREFFGNSRRNLNDVFAHRRNDAVACAAARFGVFGIGVSGKLRIVLGVVFGIAFVVCAKYTQWCVYAYRSFSYDGERKLSKQIIDGTAEHITLPEGGVGLDIGCGSGALTIACAKRNPQGKMVGIDRWGKEYASFSLPLCEKNAAAEGVKTLRSGAGTP